MPPIPFPTQTIPHFKVELPELWLDLNEGLLIPDGELTYHVSEPICVKLLD
jgi:hypothetical protein